MNRLFGTDGIRAVAGEYPLDYSTAYTLSIALISLLEEKGLPLKVIVGRDTRESGVWIEQALFHGIQDAKGEAVSAGIIPTSAVSFLTKKHSFSAGIVISASHNPYQDNGIKIFSSEGMKISDSWENKLEKAIHSSRKDMSPKTIDIKPDPSLSQDYVDFLKSTFSPISLPKKIKLILDCSNGASSFLAPQIFSDMGFETTTINASPDGKNINAGCGSLYPQNLVKKVIESQADIGIAFDGDADRALWVDERGMELNGDHTLFVLSRYLQEKTRLKSDYVVATTMSNIGLEKALEKLDLKLYRAPVGDKYVLEHMIKLNANLGGEQSGHTIFLDDCPTGDGLLTSLKMLEVLATYNKSLSELVKGFLEYPQTLKNIPISKQDDFNKYPEILKIMEHIKTRLGQSGRMNVRYSGTEPLARIMIEGENQEEIESYAQQIADVMDKYLNK